MYRIYPRVYWAKSDIMFWVVLYMRCVMIHAIGPLTRRESSNGAPSSPVRIFIT